MEDKEYAVVLLASVVEAENESIEAAIDQLKDTLRPHTSVIAGAVSSIEHPDDAISSQRVAICTALLDGARTLAEPCLTHYLVLKRREIT